MNPNKRLLLFFFLIALISCINQTEDNFEEPLFPQPISIAGYPENELIYNPFTGDSILPAVHFLGDSIKTGVPIAATASEIDVKGINLRTSKVSAVNKINAFPNVVKASEERTIIPINSDSLSIINIKKFKKADAVTYVLGVKGIQGDSVITGVPIPIIETKLPVKYPNSVKALPFRFRDKATNNMQYLDVDQGMKTSVVRDIIEDKSGNIWFGTDEGATKYNGKSFTHFGEDEGFTDLEVSSIYQDRAGNIWFAIWSYGIIKYDGKFFTHINVGYSFVFTTGFVEDQKGNLWISSWVYGAMKYDGNSITYYTINEGLPSNDVNTILNDKAGNLWIGTKKGLTRFDGEKFLNLSVKDGLSDDNIQTLVEDNSGNIWIGTFRNGISVYDGNSFTHYLENVEIISSTATEKSGCLWFGTTGNEVFKYDGTDFTKYSENEGLHGKWIKSILEDSAGNIWISTSNKGVTKFEQNSFQYFPKNNEISITDPGPVVEDKHGDIWFNSTKGLTKYDGKWFFQFEDAKGLNPNDIIALLATKDGSIWLGTDHGSVLKFDGSTFTEIYKGDSTSLYNQIFSLYEDSSGNIWIGTWGTGLIKFNGNTLIKYSKPNGSLVIQTISSITEDRDHNLWFGSLYGITKYDGKSFIIFGEKEGVGHNTPLITSMLNDKDGNLWFTSEEAGLCTYNGKEFTFFSEKEGLSDNKTYAISEDKQGVIWVTLPYGFSSIKTSKERRNGQSIESDYYTITNFNKLDGIQDQEFNRTILADSKNRMWWCTNKGLLTLDLKKHEFASKPPKVNPIQIEINQEYFVNISEADKKEMSFIEEKGIMYANSPKNLKLPYFQNHLTFHYAAIDWKSNNEIEYVYKIEGISGEWSTPTTETKVDYHDLSYGKYRFKVRARGDSKEWSEPAIYEFTISPPWRHSWWFRVLAIIAFFYLIVLYIKRRERTLLLRQIALEEKVAERTSEVVAEKKEVEKQKKRSDDLLLNILPADVAEELKLTGASEAKDFEKVTVLFSDFVGFTKAASQLSAKELVKELNHCFKSFDHIMEKYNLEKIKTIGDAYMAAGGLQVPRKSNPKDVLLAAMEMQDFITMRKTENDAQGKPAFEMRVGIHTGPVVAGIVGVKKFQYDIWGDTVNTASRIESNGEAGKVNISQATYELLKDDTDFTFESRGKIEAKGKGEIEMYFVSKD
jgi:ligand-binding sensor domain-containing protein/class 3 adenylate cyclase